MKDVGRHSELDQLDVGGTSCLCLGIQKS